MRVLALASYPVEAAARRFRVALVGGPLRRGGIKVELGALMDAAPVGAIYTRVGGRGVAAPGASEMRVLALSSYPVEAAATRFRVAQFVAPLRELGIEVELRPFMDARLFGAFYRRDGAARTAGALAVAAVRRL